VENCNKKQTLKKHCEGVAFPALMAHPLQPCNLKVITNVFFISNFSLLLAGESHFVTSHNSKWNRYCDKRDHTDMDPSSDHQNKDICQNSAKQRSFSGLKSTEDCYLSNEENKPHELWNRQYVRNPSMEVQQDSCNSFDGNNELVQLPINRNTYPALQHGSVHCNSVSTCMKSQNVFHCESTQLDSEDELDKILRF
jgi:hypothetical protein